ncbi:MAG: hypothetical protein CMH83_19625 [Nocardioides sp.]|nr:hypothetical protein [Nocardioides sp.]
MPLLPAALGVDDRHELPVGRDAWAAAYSHLTPADLTIAARWCETVDQTHEVGRVIQIVLGPKPAGSPARLAGDRLAVHTAHQAVEDRRRRLAIVERTDAERAELRRIQDLDQVDRERLAATARRDAQVDRARYRAARGQYMPPWERDLLATA